MKKKTCDDTRDDACDDTRGDTRDIALVTRDGRALMAVAAWLRHHDISRIASFMCSSLRNIEWFSTATWLHKGQ